MSDFESVTAPPAAPVGAPSAEDRQWGLFAHLAALSGVIIPFGNIIGPLVVWQVKKDSSAFAADQGKEALNFNITTLFAVIVAAILIVVLVGMLLLPLIGIAWLVFTIIAAVKANEGVAYRYPFAIRLVK